MVLESIISLGEYALVKVGMFVLVQALVYFILTSSSNIFSKNKLRSSLSFKTARSSSIRRILAVLSDLPTPASEPSPSYSKGSRSLPSHHEDDHRD